MTYARSLFVFLFNSNTLLPNPLHTEFVCYTGLPSISDYYCLKRVLLTKSTLIHDKNFQQARNRGELRQLDKEHLQKKYS